MEGRTAGTGGVVQHDKRRRCLKWIWTEVGPVTKIFAERVVGQRDGIGFGAAVATTQTASKREAGSRSGRGDDISSRSISHCSPPRTVCPRLTGDAVLRGYSS